MGKKQVCDEGRRITVIIEHSAETNEWALNNQVTKKRTWCGGQITPLVSQEGKLRVRSSSGPSALGK